MTTSISNAEVSFICQAERETGADHSEPCGTRLSFGEDGEPVTCQKCGTRYRVEIHGSHGKTDAEKEAEAAEKEAAKEEPKKETPKAEKEEPKPEAKPTAREPFSGEEKKPDATRK
jgi:hypothetical protein